MVGPIFGVESDSEEHFTHIGCDRELIPSQAQQNSEEVLESVRRVLDLGIQAFSVIKCLAVPDHSDWRCVLGLIADTEERKITSVLVEDLVFL